MSGFEGSAGGGVEDKGCKMEDQSVLALHMCVLQHCAGTGHW